MTAERLQPAMDWLAPVTLEGHRVRLVPLVPDHREGLEAAAADGELWTLWYTSVAGPGQMAAEIDRRLELQRTGTMLPFTVFDARSGKVAGMTTYMNVDARHRRVEIGSTWYAASVQRTGLNIEAKLLLLGHAFDALGCIAVEFRTHWMNHQSREAIARLGARQDGVLRHHQRMPDGSYRDTVVFSIIDAEWPAVRSHLRFRLERRA